jgi:hypothetical protein
MWYLARKAVALTVNPFQMLTNLAYQSYHLSCPIPDRMGADRSRMLNPLQQQYRSMATLLAGITRYKS